MTTGLDTAPPAEPVIVGGGRQHYAECSFGPPRPGYLSEIALAERWSRSPGTLQSWRQRPPLKRAPVPVEMFGIYAYYPLVAIWLYERDPANASVRPVGERDRPLPPLWRATPADYRAESYAVMAAVRLLDADVQLQVLRAKWAAQPIDALRACAAEMDAWAAVQDEGWTPASACGAGDHLETVQPELPLSVPAHVETAELLAGRDWTAIVPDPRFLSFRVTEVGPRIASFDLVAGYAIARDHDGGVWFASVLGGNLNALAWQRVTPLPASTGAEP